MDGAAQAARRMRGRGTVCFTSRQVSVYAPQPGHGRDSTACRSYSDRLAPAIPSQSARRTRHGPVRRASHLAPSFIENPIREGGSSITGLVGRHRSEAPEPVAHPDRPHLERDAVLGVNHPDRRFHPVKRRHNVRADLADNHERPPAKDLRIRDRIWPPEIVLAVPVGAVRNADGVYGGLPPARERQVAGDRPVRRRQDRFAAGFRGDQFARTDPPRPRGYPTREVAP